MVCLRPWGCYQVLLVASGFQVKLITVNPGGRLSLQIHHKRSEHWVVTSGCPTITVGDTVQEYAANASVDIPVGVQHRLENFTDSVVEIIEVQVGSYFGEDDIVRLDDIYGRVES